MRKAGFSFAVAIVLALMSTAAHAVPVVFTKLTGLTGGTLANTAVYKADLSSLLSSIQSISILDSNSGLGGATGQLSGFDLDAIRLSTMDCADAACAAAAPALAVFDFSSGTFFTPGSQRPPTDPKLFGTDATGTAVDNARRDARLVRRGVDHGHPRRVRLREPGRWRPDHLQSDDATSTAGLFLYIGEVGDNGEVAAQPSRCRTRRSPSRPRC